MTITRIRGLVFGVLLACCAALPTAASAQASGPTLTTTTHCLDPQSTADQYVDVTATGLTPGTAYHPQLELTEGDEEIAVGYPPGDLVADASGTGPSLVWFDAEAYLTNAPTAGDGKTVWVKLRLSSDWGVNAELSIPLCGVDTTAPVLALPADVAVDASSASGAAVTYSATASDDTDGTVAVSCDHASGSPFPVGTTAVACTATDAAGNAANGTFDVVVRPQPQPQPQPQPDLRAWLAGLGLDAQSSAALREHLDRVLVANRQTRCNALNALSNEIRAR